MRIVVLSNLFPPFFVGGYELACGEVVDALRQRGHQIRVVTSWYGLAKPAVHMDVWRLLKVRLPHDPPSSSRVMEAARTLYNRAVLQLAVGWFKPDIIYVFNPDGLGGLILDWMHSQPVPIVYDIFVFDAGLLAAYQSDPWFRFSAKKPRSWLGCIGKSVLMAFTSPLVTGTPATIDLGNSYFRSHFLKERFAKAGFDVCNDPVIYHGLRLAELSPSDVCSKTQGIVFAGRLVPEKGPHVLLEALALLRDVPHMQGMQITIAGQAVDVDYWQTLHNLARALEPSMSVHFTGHVPRSEVHRRLRTHSIFVFPVIWDEPFGIALLEAMGMGLAVIATGTGGSAEILADGQNCLIAPRQDPPALASLLQGLIADEALRLRLSRAARQTAQHFDLDQSIDSIEAHLLQVAHSARNLALIG